MKKKIYTQVSRGITFRNSKTLLCRAVSKSNYFLIGGHMHNNENPIETLKREVYEETNEEIVNVSFVKEILNIYENSDEEIFEKNFIFIFDFMSQSTNIQSKENHIKFSWHEVYDLNSLIVHPEKIKNIIYETI